MSASGCPMCRTSNYSANLRYEHALGAKPQGYRVDLAHKGEMWNGPSVAGSTVSALAAAGYPS